MANYVYRTNYFRVKNPKAFCKLMTRAIYSSNDMRLREETNENKARRFSFRGLGGFGLEPKPGDPLYIDYEQELDLEAEADRLNAAMKNRPAYLSGKAWSEEDFEACRWETNFLESLADHVAEGDACILMTIGRKDLSYLAGNATIVTSNGVRTISLDQLAIEEAQKELCNPQWTTQMSE